MAEILLGLILGVAIAAAFMLTAPWWIPLVDPLFSRWLTWVDERIGDGDA